MIDGDSLFFDNFDHSPMMVQKSGFVPQRVHKPRGVIPKSVMAPLVVIIPDVFRDRRPNKVF